ncbi:signal transduction histidine kinase [Lacibacter cauensis]|uniref:Signal transduction histidine kinase n=1 Tax=Lacibacter cauensis TaxID=510947 RepID=A0A562SK09_9BACT|nr:response regulator [Lacibacter cauensis]TWI81120.1 signal transduction histidine kinase [Lacibacter cauensis]
MQLTFDIERFERLFPFHLLVNKELNIVHAGKSLKKIIDLSSGAVFANNFTLLRPQVEQPSFEAFRLLQDQLVIIESKQTDPFMLRGQFEQTGNELLLFVGSPWFGSMKEVRERSLVLNDFAYHDPMIDLLHVIKTQEIAATEIKQLLTTVNEQKNALKNANKAIEDIALFPMQNPDPLFRINFEGEVILQNPAAENLPPQLVYNKLVFETKQFWKAVIAEILQNSPKYFLKVEAGQQFYSFNCIMLEKEGYINVYGRDITNQEQLDRSLERSANRLTTLIANLQSAVLLENENRTIALVNQKFCDTFGIPVSPESLIGTDCSEAAEQTKHLFKNPEHFVERIKGVLQNKTIVSGDKLELLTGKVLRRDFIPIWSNNQYFGHLWVYHDITEEETREQALTRQKVFYEEILNKIPADIAVFDKDHRYLFLNPVAVKDEELRKWLIGKTDEDYVQLRNKPRQIANERRAIFDAVKKEGKLLSFEERLLQPDGSEVYQLRNFNPVLNKEGEVEIMIGYGLNITERKKMEQALEKARFEAEQSSVMKDRFLAAMSHEIRTPLNGIMGVTGLLDKTNLTEKQREFVEIIKVSEAHLLRIVNEVLDFEKIVSNEIVLEETIFDVVKLVEDISGIYRLNAIDKNLSFTLLSNVKELIIRADSYRLSQVIHNLLGNALKFTQQGEIIVQLQVKQKGQTEVEVTIQVQDTGIGIDSELLTHIFEPYSQGKSAIAKQYGGTGLGLAICKRLVDSQQGSITVSSTENVGSVFTVAFTWPLAQVQKNIDNEVTRLTPPKPESAIRILIAEDVAINQFLLKHMLQSKNYAFHIADNGLAALEEFQQNDYDIILMDIEMPYMDGVETTRAIRNLHNKRKAGVPIIALTANAIKGKSEEYLEAGMNDFITKPFSEQQLTDVLQKTITQLQQQKMPGSKTKVYDLSYLKSLSNEQSFLLNMINIFVASTPVMVEELKLALDQYSYDKVATVLHKLKPAAETIGMTKLKVEIADIEQEIKFANINTLLQKRIMHVVDIFNESIVQLRSDFL